MDQPITVPCGQCIGCRLERSRQWAIRCVHEASLHDDNCFITLTYNMDNLPPGSTLVKEDWQLFMKRFRKRINKKIKFLHAGEYGYQYNEKKEIIKDSLGRELIGRPHYHAVIFGYDFEDKYHFKNSPSGMPLYRSPLLEDIWTKGFSSIGTVTFESAAYVARYSTKKRNGEEASKKCDQGLKHYERLTEDGEIIECLPEYQTMSNRSGGIGKNWAGLYSQEFMKTDSVIINGKEVKPPRYYVDQLSEEPTERLKAKRKKAMRKAKEKGEYDIDRLRDKEKVKQAQHKMLKRGMY